MPAATPEKRDPLKPRAPELDPVFAMLREFRAELFIELNQMRDDTRSRLDEMSGAITRQNRVVEAHMIEECQQQRELAAQIAAMSAMHDDVQSLLHMQRAFAETREGLPDYNGHAECQRKRGKEDENSGKLWDTIKSTAAGNVVNAIMLLCALGAYEYIAHGARL